MIRVGKAEEIDALKYDENWLIVRKPQSIPDFVKHEALLSPSPELFRIYRKAYYAGLYDQTFFDQVYVPQFIEELSQNEEALFVLRKLVSMSMEKDILLTCYCQLESMCHRSIIAGILLGMGASIETEDAYGKYFEMLIEVMRKKACSAHRKGGDL